MVLSVIISFFNARLHIPQQQFVCKILQLTIYYHQDILIRYPSNCAYKHHQMKPNQKQLFSQLIYSEVIQHIAKQTSSKDIIKTLVLCAQPLTSFSNQVFKITINNLEQFSKKLGSSFDHQIEGYAQCQLLLKIYRPIFPEFTNVKNQNWAVTYLSQLGLYPEIIYANRQYRVEKFVKGQIPDIKQISPQQLKQIARKLAQLSTNFKQYLQNTHDPHKPSLQNINRNSIQDLLHKFHQIVQQSQQNHPNQYSEVSHYASQLLGEQIVCQLKHLFQGIQLRPSHNDCHLSNILVSEEQLMILDYEFFGYSYRGYDLGNLLNECATDYVSFEIKQQLELAKQVKKQMIQEYYEAMSFGQLSKQKQEEQVQKGRLLSHLFWFFIGVKQICDPKIQFDIKYYIRRRYQEFMKLLMQMG